MKRVILLLVLLSLSGCLPPSGGAPVTVTQTSEVSPTTQPAPTATETPIPATATETPTLTPTPTEAAPRPTAEAQALTAENFITDVSRLSEAVVVKDGEEAKYANAILSMYTSGEIENFSDKVTPASIKPGMSSNNSVGLGTAYQIVDLSLYEDVNLRPFRGVTLFSDGQGGVKMVVMWLQPNRTIGLIWFHLPQKQLDRSPEGNSGFFDYSFNRDPNHYVQIITFKDISTCNKVVSDADYCAKYMSKTSVTTRDAAIAAFIQSGGFVTEEMTSGEIQFLPSGGTN